MKSDFFSKGRIQNLDALRFIAFMGVFTEHLGLHVPKEIQNESFAFALNSIFIRGYLGVNFFFVLSGFLISGKLMDEMSRTGKIDIVAYLKRRTLRIMPMFLFALGMAYLLSSFFFGKEETAPWFPFLFIHSNMWMMEAGQPANSMLSHFWSLSIEEQFYLLAPILIFILFLTGMRKRIAAFLLLACIIFRAVHFPVYGYLFYHSVTLYADFLFGVLLAMCIREEHPWIKKIGQLKGFDAGFIYLVGIFLIFSPRFDFFPPYIYFSRAVYTLFFAFVLAHQSQVINRKWHISRLPGAEKGGLISYGLYIFHPLGILMADKILSLTGFAISNPFLHVMLHAILALPMTWLMAEVGERATEKLKQLIRTSGRTV